MNTDTDIDLDIIYDYLKDNFSRIKTSKEIKCCRNVSIEKINESEIVCQNCGVVKNTGNLNTSNNFQDDLECLRLSGNDKHFKKSLGNTTVPRRLKMCQMYCNDSKIYYYNTLVSAFKNYINSVFKGEVPQSIINESYDFYVSYKKEAKNQGFRKEKKIALLAVCTYFSFLNNKVVRPQKEFPNVFNISYKSFNFVFRKFVEVLSIDLHEKTEPKDYLPFIYDKTPELNDKRLRLFIEDVISAVEELNVIKLTSPVNIACACIETVYGEIKGQSLLKYLSEMCFVSKQSIFQKIKVIKEEDNKNLIIHYIVSKRLK